jgi:putative FmdB family regulatory protein
MPLYEYQCKNCAHRFERIVKFSDPPLKTCPQCGKDTIDQMISAPAIQFKGSGWYETDYARKSGSSNYASAAKAESKSEAAAAEKSNGSADSSTTKASSAEGGGANAATSSASSEKSGGDAAHGNASGSGDSAKSSGDSGQLQP